MDLTLLSLVAPVALTIVLVWAFLKSKNIGFILVLIGMPALGIAWRIASPFIHSAMFRMGRTSGVGFAELAGVLSLMLDLIGSAIVLAGIVLIVRGLPSQASDKTSVDESGPQ